jgi:VCBS repeat-containing protein
MTNHTPVFTSSSASGSFTETSNTTGSTTLHTLTGTMNFTDADHSDTHTTTATLHSSSVSGGTVIPAASLAHFNAAMTSHITSDSNGSGKLTWTFGDADDDFDFLSKNQTLTLTYDIKVSDNHGGTAIQTVVVTVTGTDDKPVISTTALATVTEQANHTLSLSPDTVHVALNFTDQDLANTGHTASVLSASATGVTTGILPDGLGTAELMAFFNIDNVVKSAGSSAGVINTTFQAPDLAFDYLAAGEHLNITYVVQLDDHAGGVSTQNVQVTVVGTNDKPFYLSGPEIAHLTEGQNVDSSGNLHATGDLLFTDVDLSDTHTVATTVTATRSGGGAIPLTNAQLLAAFSTALTPDSTGHLIGDVDWHFALNNSASSFLAAGETLTLTYHLAVTDPSLASDSQDVTITILGTNHPVVITSGPESASVSELAGTTGSAAVDTTATTPAGTLAFTDADTGDTHTVATSLLSTSGPAVPAATQADLTAALSTTLHDSTGTGTGTVDWNFNVPDHDLDFLSEGQTLTVNYNVKVSDASTNANQTVSVVITGTNDPVTITSGPQSGSVAEQANTSGSTALDSTTPVPTGTLAFTDVDLSDTHSVIVAVDSAVWSGGDFIPDDTLNDLQAALMTSLHDSTGTGTGTGGIDWTFAIQDKDLDFLGAGETLTVTYDVTVSDGLTTSTQQVTVTATGALDPLTVNPVVTAISDTAAADAGSIVWTGNVITDGSDNGGDASVALHVTDVNGHPTATTIAGAHGTLFVDTNGTYTYTANTAFDQMQVGDTATETYNFTVTDSLGRSQATTLTLNLTGAADAPVITSADTSGTMTEDLGPTLVVNGGFETGDLTGWTASGTPGIINAQFTGLGGEFGNYMADLGPTTAVDPTLTLQQSIATTPGEHYTVSFYVLGDTEASSNFLNVTWDGGATPILALTDVFGGLTRYSFDVVASSAHTTLAFTYADDGTGLHVDQVTLGAATGQPTESSDGTIAFSDIETADTHTANFTPDGSGYLGTFSIDPLSESGGSGSVAWHYTVNNSDIQFLAAGQQLIQSYTVNVTDNHGATTPTDVTITINGANDAPTAVGETVIADAGASGVIDIPGWALGLNDTDPDTIDHHTLGTVVSSTGGFAFKSLGDAFFIEDATPGGSFDYTSSDGIANSANTATATLINNATSTPALVGTGGDDILIATNGSETLSGGGGNDVLIGNSGAHTLTGGSGNDNFAFLQPSNGVGTITDFNNTTEQDHIVVSASGYGGGLSAHMDTSSVFESSGDDQFSGGGAVFHFDTANETLYFSADGTTASAITLAQVQAGVTLHAHDLLIV